MVSNRIENNASKRFRHKIWQPKRLLRYLSRSSKRWSYRRKLSRNISKRYCSKSNCNINKTNIRNKSKRCSRSISKYRDLWCKFMCRRFILYIILRSKEGIIRCNNRCNSILEKRVIFMKQDISIHKKIFNFQDQTKYSL